MNINNLGQYQGSQCRAVEIKDLLPTGSEEREVLGVGSTPVAIFPSCKDMKLLHHNCIDIHKVG